MGEWTPVFKKEDKQDYKNYHPITVLPTVDKRFETLLAKQIDTHYDHCLYDKMTACRKKHSCETSLLRLVEEWKSALDKKDMVSVLSTDMSKAFDSLSSINSEKISIIWLWREST